MDLKHKDLQYKCDPRASTLPLSLDGDNNLSNHLTYQHFKDIRQDLKQDRFDYDYGGDLEITSKKVKKAHPKRRFQPSINAIRIDWNYWRAFYYVVKTGGFTRAEDYLDISQSSISRTIQKLEKILGQQLLIRRLPKSNTLMSLTPAGAKILAQISPGVESFEAFNAHVRQNLKKKRKT